MSFSGRVSLSCPKLSSLEKGRQQIHICQYLGAMKVDYYLNGHEDVIFDKVHMDANTFIQLSGLFESRGLLHSTQRMSVNCQLFIFLAIIAKAYTIKDSTDHQQRSNETISRCFKNFLEAICRLNDEFIRPLDYNEVEQLLRANPNKFLVCCKSLHLIVFQ